MQHFCNLHPESHPTQPRSTNRPPSTPTRSKERIHIRPQHQHTPRRMDQPPSTRVAVRGQVLTFLPFLPRSTEAMRTEHPTPATVRHGVHSIHRIIPSHRKHARVLIDQPAIIKRPSRHQRLRFLSLPSLACMRSPVPCKIHSLERCGRASGSLPTARARAGRHAVDMVHTLRALTRGRSPDRTLINKGHATVFRPGTAMQIRARTSDTADRMNTNIHVH